MQLQQIRPDFSGSAQSMQAAQKGIQQVGQFANDWMDRLAKERAEQERIKERQQDVDFRNSQAALQQENWAKSFGLQEAADKRAQAEQLAKEATRQAYGKFGELATAPNQTQAQVAKIMSPNSVLAKAQAEGRVLTPREEALIAGQVSKDLATNKGSLAQQRQLLLEQGPVRELYDVVKDPVTGKETVQTRADIDTTSQQAYKQSLLDNLDKRIGDQERLAQEWAMMKAREAGENARLNKRLAAEKDTKPDKLTMTKILPDGRTQEVEVRTAEDATYYRNQGYTPGKITGSYKPDTKDGGTGTPVVPLRTGTGSWDDARLSKLATTLQTAGLSGKDSVGLANLAAEDKWYGTGVNFNKVLDPVYEKLRKKDPTITKTDVANMINTAFD